MKDLKYIYLKIRDMYNIIYTSYYVIMWNKLLI